MHDGVYSESASLPTCQFTYGHPHTHAQTTHANEQLMRIAGDKSLLAGSNMHLRLQADGSVSGVSVERGKFIQGNSVEGKIRGGRWWAEGYVEVRPLSLCDRTRVLVSGERR